jgi:hypothetical protein
MATLRTRIYRNSTSDFPGWTGPIATVEAGVDQFTDTGGHMGDAETLYYWLRHSYGDTDGPLLGPIAVAIPPLVVSIRASDTTRWEGDSTIVGGYYVYEVTLEYSVNHRTKSTRIEYNIGDSGWYLLETQNVDPSLAQQAPVQCSRGATVEFRVTPFTGLVDGSGNATGTPGVAAVVAGAAAW